MVTVAVRDGLGNLTQEQSPDRGTTAATFDAAGNLLTRTDARGVTVTTTYDALNRPLTETYSTGETVTTTYGQRARLHAGFKLHPGASSLGCLRRIRTIQTQ